jgi:hypothetical protein
MQITKQRVEIFHNIYKSTIYVQNRIIYDTEVI